MTTTVQTPVWRPFVDEPLFVPELLHGPDAVPADILQAIVAYLTAVADARRAPLHTCTAFNALYFGFDLTEHGYRAEVLSPDLFVGVNAEQQHRQVLPVGTFVHLDRGGRRSLLAEVVARFGADPGVDDDGWAPPAVSGAEPGYDGGTGQERVVLDMAAFGAPNAADYSELARLRRRGAVLDSRGHLTGPVSYPAGTGGRDDVALYAAYLLGPGRTLLLGGPLADLLTDPGDDRVLTAAVHQALDTIGRILDTAAGLRRWHGYTVTTGRFTRRLRKGWPGLTPADIGDVVSAVRRSGPQPRYTGVWPLLAGVAEGDTDPLDLDTAAEVVVAVNLAVADEATTAADGLLPGGVHLRVDDVWQAGGIWRTQREPIPAPVLATDPRTPLGLGHQPVTATGDDSPEPGPGASTNPSTGGPATEPDTSRLDTEPGPAGSDDPGTDDPGAGTSPDAEASHDDELAGADSLANSDRSDEPDPGVGDTAEPDEPEPDLALDGIVVRDSLVVYTVALRDSHINSGELPLPGPAADVLTRGPLIVQLHHDGEILDDTEQIQQVTLDGTALTGIGWPWSFYPGIKVTVATARNASRISVTTTLLDQPLPYGDQFRWDTNTAILAAALGLTPPARRPDSPEPEPALPTGVSERQRGVGLLRGLILAAIRRHGRPGSFGSRQLTGPQLLAALFGPDLVAPPLMWQVIYTCDRLTEAGKLTKEAGTDGPDTFIWWPDDTARRNAHHTARAAVLAGQVREHWVPAFKRRLPEGYEASEAARREYAAHMIAIHGPGADTELPRGHTWVRGQLRGSGEPDSLLRLADPHH
jgi:hypothetical protein